MLAALPEVAGAVVVHDHAIEAYLVLAEGAEVSAVEREITTRLAAYKRPRRLHVVGQLPRTATGKLVRDRAVLSDRAVLGDRAVLSDHAVLRDHAVPSQSPPKGSADHDR